MGRDGTERNGAGAKMPSDGNKEEEEGDGEVIILWNENSPKTRPVEQLVPPVLGTPNVRRNTLSHSIPSRPTYQTVP
ncbi:S ribonuclease [Pyrus ussuriensis x Pyrus communis]|uniref:S ribonuclease n=1 Tax=Pyrus ussuriensis x Pyrus communis TaxID=2448454 RepID=A0A5N5F5Z9_9ROSA|nr:S ribonuclease [Pyrus ussuriensis x Pyrus communis]